ncbi:TLR cluster3 member 2 [Biomphalaria glabrata]|uniref:Toll-like receptor 4 n=1 Tax=Biomphalaria glabrata TaxID=6526 RepID=A0A9W2ZJP9_BIOGL|nr:toll-like receptor 4 [Biomphalaria glabrata]KAI8766539.1 hypothetical protein BgiMline_004209 [Biomphalaria glabrata]
MMELICVITALLITSISLSAYDNILHKETGVQFTAAKKNLYAVRNVNKINSKESKVSDGSIQATIFKDKSFRQKDVNDETLHDQNTETHNMHSVKSLSSESTMFQLKFSEWKGSDIFDKDGNCSIVIGCTDLYHSDSCLVCHCSENYTITTVADCSNANLDQVPTQLPSSISHLLLAYNRLNSSSLYPGVFDKYTDLEVLQLDSNNITTLADGVFRGLYKLERLNVYNNSIAMDSNLNKSRVFAPLNGSLVYLVMNRNNPNTSNPNLVYPDYAFSLLTNLKTLYIDGLRGKRFGPLFGSLKYLTKLVISGYDQGYCFLESLHNDTFKYLGHLKDLNISNCGLEGSLVESGAFAPLNKLTVLDLTNNFYLGLEAIGNLMYGLRNSQTLRRLKIQRVVPRFSPCILILSKTLRYFRNMSLEIIEAMDNEIEMIEFGALKMLPATLKTVNLTNNKIMFGAYWKNMGELFSLENLHLDGFFKPVQFPLLFPDSSFKCVSPSEGYGKFTDNECICKDNSCSEYQTDFMLPLPPMLRNVTMHSNSMTYIINNITFCSNNKLDYVDLTKNHFQALQGPVIGLKYLRVLKMSSCFIESISDKFFDNLTSLEHLNLYQNLLGDCLNADLKGLIFDKLTHMESIDISFNNLYRLNENAFGSMENLLTLDLSINRLSQANFSITHMKRLQFIDLHRNEISSLPEGIRSHISWLLSRGVNITIDMRQNPIECDCGNLDFLQWVVDTKVFGSNYSYYYCKFPIANAQALEMKNGYDEQVAMLSYSCEKHITMFLSVAGGTLLMVLVLIASLIYRFRWTLRYWYHAAKSKISSTREVDVKDFKYDVFVSYANSDIDFILQELIPKLKERGIRVLVHGEKFKVGRYITDNIYKAVVKSRKTLIVITKHMLDSYWCKYELQMARMQSVSTGRDVLVFLFLEDIPSSKLGPEVLAHVKSSTYINYPKLPQHKGAFWDKLADDLRSS